MALIKKAERGVKEKEKISIMSNIQPMAGSDDPSYTGLDKAIMELAKTVIIGVLVLIGLLFAGLFALVLSNNQQVSLFKDIVSTFMAVASGLLGSILGYYYRSRE
ncbi:MAG: hypothetical protein MUP45_04480 [Candidatus Marinimicrobia bacterium]|nr:hypothetical protein [Candidatus Neomarinimicrobiota bacterium]